MEYSRNEVGHLDLTPKGQKKLERDLLREVQLDSEYERLEKEFEIWNKENEVLFKDTSLSNSKRRKLKREMKGFKKKFNHLIAKYEDLSKKNMADIAKEVKRHG